MKVSVIIPVYKVEKYLWRCVGSIMCQSFRELEIILVDDGSPDNCGFICDQLATLDSRIQVIHQKNQGLSEARNRGIEICSGDYILFVDSDDYVESNTVEYLLQTCLDKSADVCCCGYYLEKGNSVIPYQLTDTVKCYEEDEIVLASVDGRFSQFVWNKLWKRELFDEECQFPPGRNFEDISTIWKVFNKCHRVICVPDLLFHYSIRKDSISNTKNMKNLIDHWVAYKERFDEMASRNERLQSICMQNCLGSIGYVWRWLYGVDKNERKRQRDILQEMRTFARTNRKSIQSCTIPTRISLFCALHSNPVTIMGCYYMNQFYRKFVGKEL